jgi:hypothetical protein
MDEIFQECLKEISIHGFEGCSFSKMIEGVSSCNSTIMFDGFMEKKLFSLLRDEFDVSIYQPRPPTKDKEEDQEKQKLIFTNEGVLYFSDRILYERTELTELNDEIKNNAIFVTSYHLRLKVLGISESTRKTLSNVQFGLLEGKLDFLKFKKLEKRKPMEPTKMSLEKTFLLMQEI